MDDIIGATGIACRALTCASLMENILRQAGPIRDDSVFYQPTPGDLKLPHVAKTDVADNAARLLSGIDWHDARDVPQYGSKNLSFYEMALIVSDVLGRNICFQEMTMGDFAPMLTATGATVGMTQSTVEMLTAKNAGMNTTIRPMARGDTPTTFHEWRATELRPALAG